MQLWVMAIRAVSFVLLLMALAGCADGENSMTNGESSQAVPLSFANLERTGRPNDALAAPEGYTAVHADVVSPAYPVSAEALFETAREVLEKEPRTRILAVFREERQLALEQRSALFGFRDSIWVQAIERNDGSSLLMYSRSNVGYWDLGVNRNRIESWLAAIGKAVAAKSS